LDWLILRQMISGNDSIKTLDELCERGTIRVCGRIIL